MKRLVAPKSWPIKRKEKKFVICPTPGPHPKYQCIPLGVLLRDFFHYARTLKEVKKILNSNLVKVDNRIRRDYRFPVGLMDVVCIGDERYRIMPSEGGLIPIKIHKSDSSTKFLKLMSKKSIKKGNVQLNFHDGKNLIVEENVAKEMKTGDVVVFDLTSNKIKSVLKQQEGAECIVTKGTSMGRIARIEKIIKKRNQSDMVILVDKKGKITTPRKYIFVIPEKMVKGDE